MAIFWDKLARARAQQDPPSEDQHGPTQGVSEVRVLKHSHTQDKTRECWLLRLNTDRVQAGI